MYQRFTDRARRVMQLANQQALNRNHEYIAPEHILLGLIKEGTGVGFHVLANLEGDPERINSQIKVLIQDGPEIINANAKLPMTPRGKKVVEIALEERQEMDHDFVGTEHLLLALINVADSVAFYVLKDNGIDSDQAKEEVLRILDSEPTADDHPLTYRISQQENVKRKKRLSAGQLSTQRKERNRRLKEQKKKRKHKRSREPSKGNSMYERFTDRARRVMQLANQEAQRFNHEYIGTEHVLLGLVKEGTGVACNVLTNLDVDLRKTRQEVEKLVQSGPEMITMGKLPQTPRAKKVLEHSMEEARDLNHNFVGTEHLLLGLIRVDEGVAAQVLTALGLELNQVRTEVLNLLGHDEIDVLTRTHDRARNLPGALRNLPKLDLVERAERFPRPITLDESTMQMLYVGMSQANRNNVFLIGPPWMSQEYFRKLGTDMVDGKNPQLQTSENVFQVDQSVHTSMFPKACKGTINSETRAVFCFYLSQTQKKDQSRTFFLDQHEFDLENQFVSFVVAGSLSDWQQFKFESPVLASHFTVVKLNPLSVEGSADVVRLGTQELELRHTVVIGQKAVDKAIDLASTLDSKIEIPNSAIKILDYAATHKKLFFRSDETEALKAMRTEIEGVMQRRRTAMSAGEFRLAKSLEENLLRLRSAYFEALPEQPMVKPKDIQSAFEAISRQ